MNCLKCLLPLTLDNTHYGLHNECFTTWFNVPSTAEFISLTRQSSGSSDQTISQSPRNNSFFQGKFKKYSAELQGDSYILKMREIDAPELPEVEYLCNQVGKSLEIQVAEFYIINFNEERVFVTKNFIRQESPTDLQHIHHFRANNQHSCESLIKVIIEQTKRPYDVSRFIRTILFDALIGNHDRHGKNLALIVTSKDTTLSPIYDNVSYLSLEKGNMLKADFNPTGKISTQSTDEPSMRDYVKEFKRLKYFEEVINFYRRINIKKLYELVQKSFCSALMQEALMKLMTKRYKELEDALKN